MVTVMTKKTMKVKKSTAHTVKTISKKKGLIIAFFAKLPFAVIAICISYHLYTKCLIEPDVNPIVVIYFSLIGLACFIKLGFPIEKLANMELVKK